MNSYLVTLSSGATSLVQGENYNAASPSAALTITDQFGATLATFAAGAWADIAVVNLSASPAETTTSTAYQPSITASDPNVQGTYEAGNTVWTGGA